MYHVAGATHKGCVKPQNEDHILLNGRILNEGFCEIIAPKILACVADGVSGEDGGHIASRLALETFQKNYNLPITGKNIFETFQMAHENLRLEKNYPYMATTMVGAFMDSESNITFNVGDSKAYLYKFGALRQISTDHTTANELLRQGIKSDVNPHQISRFLGGKDTFSEPDIKNSSGKIKGTNNYILLCSDGLTDFVKLEYIEKVLESNKSLVDKTRTLIALAIKCNTSDNVSVILIEWKEDEANE